MSKNVIFGPHKNTVVSLTEAMKGEDKILAIAPLAGELSTHSPVKSGKYKGYHRIKCEVLIPEYAIKGNNAITNFTAAMLLGIPSERVDDDLKS